MNIMNAEEKTLIKYFRELESTDRQSVINFAHFLFSQSNIKESVPETPVNIERPAQETVVAAIKRLKKTYPMLDPSQVLNPASAILTQHLMQGKDRVIAIDELERLFSEKYSEFLSARSKQETANES